MNAECFFRPRTVYGTVRPLGKLIGVKGCNGGGALTFSLLLKSYAYQPFVKVSGSRNLLSKFLDLILERAQHGGVKDKPTNPNPRRSNPHAYFQITLAPVGALHQPE